MRHHPAGVEDHVELAEMQRHEMHPLEMDPHVGLGLLQGLMPLLRGMHPLGEMALLTGMHPQGGMALLPHSEGRGKHPHQLGVGVDGRLSFEESWGVSNSITMQRVLLRWWTNCLPKVLQA